MIKRSHIRHFLAVVETGSFTQAAHRIRVTQPTLSLGIAELERLVRAQLFVRTRKRIGLTDAGAHFLPIARDLERGFRQADAFGRGEADDWPQLKLGVIRSISADLLETVVAALAAEFSIELIEGTDSELRAALASHRIHLALGVIGGETAGAVPLLEEPFVMLVPEGRALPSRVRPEDLAAEVMILRRGCESLDETSRFFTRHDVRPRFALRSDSDERCIRMVAAGLGMTTAPLSLRGLGTRPIVVTGYDLRRVIGFRCETDWLAEAQAPFERAVATILDRLARPDGPFREAGTIERHGDHLVIEPT